MEPKNVENCSISSEFLSIVSHELKTPITSLKMRIQMARKAATECPKTAKMLDSANSQLDRLVQLVDDMLDFSCIQAGRLRFVFAPTNLAEVVDRALSRFQFELANVGSEVQLNMDRTVFGNWDRTRLEQVLINLLANVKKYAPGSIVEINVSRENKMAVLVVRDYGPGIPRNLQAEIFNRFSRAVSSDGISGLGLGLYICQHIVEFHGGTIEVESEPGHGAMFIIRLPMQTSLPA